MTTMTTTADITRARRRAAEQDLERARQHGELLIAQTTQGVVALRATRFAYPQGTSAFWYTLVRLGQHAHVLAEGRAGAVKEALAALYVVEAG